MQKRQACCLPLLFLNQLSSEFIHLYDGSSLRQLAVLKHADDIQILKYNSRLGFC